MAYPFAGFDPMTLYASRLLIMHAGRLPNAHSGDIHARWPRLSCDSPGMSSQRLVIAAIFDPPAAHDQFSRWRSLNAALLSELSDEDVRVDTGRTDRGDFVRDWLPPEAADRAAESHSRTLAQARRPRLT
jgi:hypothetical protein